MNEQNKHFISVSDAALFSDFDKQTIRKMVNKKEIRGFQTLTGRYRVNRSSLEKMCNFGFSNEKQSFSTKQNFLYTRVSTRKQMDDLSRQLDYIKKPEYTNYTVIQDIGSGVNFKRKGLSKILESCIQGTIGEVIVAHKDRLSRFGNLVENIN